MYGYCICDSCKDKLRLFTDATIRKYKLKNPAFEKEIQDRLDFLERDYMKKKIKLLYVQDRLEEIENE